MRAPALLLICLSFAGCGTLHGDPVSAARGTISGSLRAPGHEATIANRDITIVDRMDGRTFHAHTNDAGGYSVVVPPGTYTVSVVLRPREILSSVPQPVSVEAGGVKADVDVIIAAPAEARR